MTKGTVSPSVLNTGADTGPLQDQYWVQVWLIQAGNGLWDIQVIVNLENEETILPEFEAVVSNVSCRGSPLAYVRRRFKRFRLS